MQLHAPTHATYPVSARFLAVAYAGFIVVLVFATIAVLASRSRVFGASDAAAQTVAPAAVRTLNVGAYALQVRALPRRIGEQTTVSVRLLQGVRAVDGARVRITFTMPAMSGMRGLSTLLRQTAPGVYAHAAPILTMGRWHASVQVTPAHGKSVAAGFTYRVGA
jgi:hypothetical protein